MARRSHRIFCRHSCTFVLGGKDLGMQGHGQLLEPIRTGLLNPTNFDLLLYRLANFSPNSNLCIPLRGRSLD